MKKYKEWLTNEIEIMESETSENYPHEQMVEKEVVLNLINQLGESEVKQLERKIKELESFNDELIRDNNQLRNELDNQEVLSQGENINIVLDDLKEYIKEQQSLSQNVGLAHTPAGNDTHYRQYDYVLECIDEYEPSDDLKNLIIPKQELPVIPKYVAKWIEENRKVYEDKFFIIGYYLYDNAIHPDVDDWLVNNQEKFVKAWFDGYEVEEEQKYYVLVRDEEYGGFWFLSKKNNGDISIGVNRNYSEVDWDTLKLTEQEIKDYDERYWAFAKKVEELEE